MGLEQSQANRQIDKFIDTLKVTDRSLEERVAQLETHEGGASPDNYILIREEQAAGVAGGTFTSGAWQTRILNTEVFDNGNYASLASNQITLIAGTYRIYASAPAGAVRGHKARLRNITLGATLLVGTSEYTDETGGHWTRSHIAGEFTLSTDTVIEIQHQCTLTKATNGFGGTDGGFSVIEVYTMVELWKLS